MINRNNVDVIRNNFHGHHHPPRPYWTPGWYSHYPTLWHWGGPSHVWWVRPVWSDCLGWFAAGFFTSTVVNHIIEPVPYYYGSNVVYRGGMVYVNGVPYVSAEEYYRQAQALAVAGQHPAQIDVHVNVNNAANNGDAGVRNVAAQVLDETEWLPLGTFAILTSPNDQNFSRIMQLASSKDGKIRGNVVDVDTDEAYSLLGTVDSKTQRVAMSNPEYPSTIIECGLWNLTQDTLTVLVHRGPTTTDERTLVRLADPDSANNDDGPKRPSPNEPQLKF